MEHDLSHIATMVTKLGLDLPPGINSNMESDGKEMIPLLNYRHLLSLHEMDYSILDYGPRDTSFFTMFGNSKIIFLY